MLFSGSFHETKEHEILQLNTLQLHSKTVIAVIFLQETA